MNKSWARTLAVMALSIIIIGLILVSYIMYAYDFVGKCGQIWSVLSFALQCVVNVSTIILFSLLHDDISN